jgi:hypothetical protein
MAAVLKSCRTAAMTKTESEPMSKVVVEVKVPAADTGVPAGSAVAELAEGIRGAIAAPLAELAVALRAALTGMP